MFASNPSAARNEFLEPPPQDQSRATLVLGRQRIVCRLTEVSIGGFSVMIPRATCWAGEPTARLITHEATYRVQIIKQEIRYEGIEITLERLEDIVSDEDLPTPQRWVIHASRCCAIGLILAITYCLVAAPGGVTVGPGNRVSLSDLTDYLSRSWSAPPTVAEQQPDADADDPVLLPTITVSSSSQAKIDDQTSDRSGVGVVGQTAAANAQALDRPSLLRAALQIAQSQRSRPVNSGTVPWLFTTGPSSPKVLPSCRMARTAEEDLQAFATCLKSLSVEARSDAIQSLRKAIVATETSSAFAVAGLPTLRMVRSADAEIYFRVVDGETELLRVLPVELPEASPVRVPSATSQYSQRH